MALPTAIERLNAHLIGFVRAYTFQLARRVEPQLPDGDDAPGRGAADDEQLGVEAAWRGSALFGGRGVHVPVSATDGRP